jgi:cytochrome c
MKLLLYSRHLLSGCVLLLSLLTLESCDSGSDGPRVLVFSKTKGYQHGSIPYGIAAIQKLGEEHGFAVDTTRSSDVFTDDNLKKYKTVVFNCTTGNVLNAKQQAAFERYIQAGGGYVGIHSAADTEYDWPWYGKLMGAHFSSHPRNSNIQKATVLVTDTTHISTKGLPAKWERTDEWYSYKSFYSELNVLAYLDENTYNGGTNGANHPIAWYHEFDGGRAFYTGGGHVEDSFSDPLFLQHLYGGIQYAMGENVTLDYSKSYAVEAPEENRFVKTILVNDLDVPMEMAIADDGRLFYTEMFNGKVWMFDTKSGENKLVHQLDVMNKGGTGLIGVTLDPNFASNRYIYLYHSPPMEGEPFFFHLSRFVVTADNTLDLNSEKVLLKVPVQINSGAHHGGSLAFDKDGNLILSTGDGTTPFPSNGYAPIDERPEPEYFPMDAQRSAANTNDFKGKILRIRPQEDGTYTIPEGNLFAPGTEKTLPEIYAMGCRNPYRIAINPKTGTIYWGEIGPDAGEDSIQGPRGYDEFNQAKKAGYFGWPYFVGDNYAYTEWDFATNTAGPKYDPAAPVNNSPNNTGLANLPPATPAMIWYPYAASPDFPELGKGGRSAMAGSFYTYNASQKSPNGFPEYFDGSLFVFDWMRNWVIVLRFDENENYVRNEPFMTNNGDFRRPIDMVFSKEGVMYMLEYGSVYGADNDDARLVRVEYNTGNRPPIARASIVDSVAMEEMRSRAFVTSESRYKGPSEIAGVAPLSVKFSSAGTTDYDDDDEMSFQWLFDGKTVGATKRSASYTYETPGLYNAVLRVIDKAGAVGLDTVLVRVGNERPQATVETAGNKSFFWDNNPSFSYKVVVNDKEEGGIPASAVTVLFDYNPTPSMAAAETVGHQAVLGDNSLGKSLIEASDCKACHTVRDISVGPAYLKVAERYKGNPSAVNTLARKIIQGGGGNWGDVHVMAAHPQIPMDDAKEIVNYILSLANPSTATTLPAEGKVALNKHKKDDKRGVYNLLATYTDKGANGVGPLTGSELITLRNARVSTVFADAHEGFPRWGNSLSQGGHKSYILLKNIDMTGIKGFSYEYAADKKNGYIEVRLDSYAGPIVSKTDFVATGSRGDNGTVRGTLEKPLEGRHDMYFFVMKPEKPNDNLAVLKTIQFEK